MQQWLYNGQEVVDTPEGVIGFVYMIHNLLDGRKYIGKKLLTFSSTKYKTVVLKSGLKKKKKIKSQVQSDWLTYFGSSEELKKDVETLGADNFRREVLHYCKTKAECSYVEMKLQCQYDVLLKPTEFYNAFVGGKIHRNHLKHLHAII